MPSRIFWSNPPRLWWRLQDEWRFIRRYWHTYAWHLDCRLYPALIDDRYIAILLDYIQSWGCRSSVQFFAKSERSHYPFIEVKFKRWLFRKAPHIFELMRIQSSLDARYPGGGYLLNNDFKPEQSIAKHA